MMTTPPLLTLCLLSLYAGHVHSRTAAFCSEQFEPCEPLLVERDMIGSDSLSVMQLLWTLNSTEAIRDACDGYRQFMQCAQRRIRRCIDGSRTLISVSRVLHLLCRNGVEITRNQLMSHGSCIQQVMEKTPTNKCKMTTHPSSHQVSKCREICGANIECLVGVWISEQSLCALLDLENECGKEAVDFYSGLRTEVFNSFYPVLCFAQYSYPSTPGQETMKSLHTIIASKTRLEVEAASDELLRRRQERSYGLLTNRYITRHPYNSETGSTTLGSAERSIDRFDIDRSIDTNDLFDAKQRFEEHMRPIQALLSSWQGLPWYLRSGIPGPKTSMASPSSRETELYGAKVDNNFPLLIYTTLKDLMERYVHIYFNRDYVRA